MNTHTTARTTTWLLPPLVTAGLGAWRLDRAALWADELATWGAVRLDWDRLWRLAGSVDAVITPYYAALKVLDPADLRLPSLVATVLTSLVVVALGRRAGGDPAGLTAGSIYAVLPVTSRYAQEARPYAWTVLFAALALLALFRLLDRPTRPRAAAYATAVALTGLCHPLSALLMIVGHAPAGWRARRVWPAAALIGALPALGLGVAAAGQTGQVAWIGRVGLDNLHLVPAQFFVSGVTGGLLLVLAVLGFATGMTEPSTATTNPDTGTTRPAAGMTDPDTSTTEPATPTTDPDTSTTEPATPTTDPDTGGTERDTGTRLHRVRPALVLAGAGLLPPVLLLAAGTVAGVWVARYVLFAVPALVALAAAAVVRAGRLPAAASVALIAVLGWPAQVDIREPAGHGQASDRIAGVIGPRHRDGDVAVFPDTHPSMPWVPRDIYERYVPLPRPPDVLAVAPQRADGRLTARECADPAGCLGVPARIWIVRTDNAPDPLHDMSPAKRTLIGAGYRLHERWDFLQLSVILMERRAQSSGHQR